MDDSVKANFVPRLEHLAFEKSFKEIVSNLIMCPEHRPEGKRFDWASSSSFLSTNPLCSSQNMINFVKGRLDQILIGTMNDEIRRKFIQRFYKICANDAKNEYIPDVWVFLDCVLDDGFKDLETHIVFPGSRPDSRLIPTIAKRSPQLAVLQLNFSLIDKDKWNHMVPDLKPVLRSLNSLSHLTSLTLSNMNYAYKPIMSVIGNSCPSLSFLSLDGGFHNTKRDILALILGEVFDQLNPHWTNEMVSWSKDGSLELLRVPSEYLTRICFSLRDLWLTDNSDDIRHQHYCSKLSPSAVAFLLRHVPLLEDLTYCSTTALAVKILHDAPIAVDSKIQSVFEKDYRKAFNSIGKTPNHRSPELKLIPSPTFSGSLVLKDLEFVSILDVDLLRAIGSACPCLTQVVFGEEKEGLYPEGKLSKDSVSPECLESIFGVWPKLKSITLEGVSPEYVKPILKAFRSTLEYLLLDSCPEIDIIDLAACSSLVHLRIMHSPGSLVSKVDETPLLSADTFLPNLKYFQTDNICLGKWSRLIEDKPGLVNLELHCFHIGTEMGTRLEWSTIPKMWPKLKYLHIAQCADLTMAIVSDLIDQLVHLKRIDLPRYVELDDYPHFSSDKPSLLSIITANCSGRRPPIEINFRSLDCDVCVCPFVKKIRDSRKSESIEMDSSSDDDLINDNSLGTVDGDVSDDENRSSGSEN